jgi:hypothetical protein
MSWKYNGEDFIKVPNKMEGFVYIITNLTNNKKGKCHNVIVIVCIIHMNKKFFGVASSHLCVINIYIYVGIVFVTL